MPYVHMYMCNMNMYISVRMYVHMYVYVYPVLIKNIYSTGASTRTIVGGVVGGICGLILLALIIIPLCWCCIRDREKSSRQSKIMCRLLHGTALR